MGTRPQPGLQTHDMHTFLGYIQIHSESCFVHTHVIVFTHSSQIDETSIQKALLVNWRGHDTKTWAPCYRINARVPMLVHTAVALGIRPVSILEWGSSTSG